MSASLGRLHAVRKTGNETLHDAGMAVGGSVLDFWQWSASDLMSNATRGRLAEYIVYRAVGGAEAAVRDEWDAFDLTTPNGIRVEVKSAAYIQSWQQKRESLISFRCPKTRAWSPDTNALDRTARRQANVYVFALLHEREAPDPLNVRHWQFYVVSARALDVRSRSQDSITLASLDREAGPAVDFAQLGAAITAAHGVDVSMIV